MNISYDYYRIFYYVAKYKNITQASRALLSSQPNITRTIKLLEDTLGCTLFMRSNRGVVLTPEGEKLYMHIRAAFEHIQAGEEELSLISKSGSGLLSVSVTEIGLHCLMLPVLKQFHNKHPNISIRLFNASTPQALEHLKSGFCDIAVVTSRPDSGKTFEWTPIKKFFDCAVCGTYFSKLRNRKVTLEQLLQYPLVATGKQTSTYSLYSDFFLKRGLDFNPRIEASTTDLILPMVKNDLGIGFVPEEFVENDSSSDFFVIDLCERLPERTIYVVKNAERTTGASAKELEKMINDIYIK